MIATAETWQRRIVALVNRPEKRRYCACDSSAAMYSVLVVSHDRDLREVAARVLRKQGWRVMAAAHGGHALLACAGQAFDVLVVEDAMPEETGAGLARRLRRYLPHLQIVRMMNQPASAEADGIAVVRPFTADDLIDAVLQSAADATAAV